MYTKKYYIYTGVPIFMFAWTTEISAPALGVHGCVCFMKVA
jgi:acylphosphatase